MALYILPKDDLDGAMGAAKIVASGVSVWVRFISADAMNALVELTDDDGDGLTEFLETPCSPDWVRVAGSRRVPGAHIPRMPDIQEHKDIFCERLDRKTRSLIKSGFSVNSKVFSASDASQLKWLGMFMSKDLLQYPIEVPTLDDKDSAILNNAAELTTYYTALVNHVQTHLKSGVALKMQVAAAETKEELDAILDER